MVAAVKKHGLALKLPNANLEGACRLLDQVPGFSNQSIYRQPVAWMLVGDLDKAHEILDKTEDDLGGRDDIAEGSLRSYIRTFRDCYAITG